MKISEKINPESIKNMGAYSQAVKVDLGTRYMILLSGQIALDGEGKPVAPGDIGGQARFIFENIKMLLGEAGATIDDVVKVQIFVEDMNEYKIISAIRNEYFADSKPVSTLLEISRTAAEGCNIEIEVMAIIDKQ